MKKRLFSIMLAALLVLASVPIASFADEVEEDPDNPYMTRFTVDTVNVGNDDETVQINISVDVNNGFAAMTYQLTYDSDVLSLEQQPELGGIDSFMFVPGPLEKGKHTGLLSSPENVTETGVLVTYTFKINPDAPTGTYGIQLVTDGKAETANGILKLEVIDEDHVPVVNIPVNGGVVIPGYMVTYDANGGSGAPQAQVKNKNGFVRISSTLPVRDGYICRGWAASSTATTPEYKAGDMYSENADLLLYAVWEKQEVIAGSIDLAVSTVSSRAGNEAEVAISIANHPGVGGIQLDVIFDDTKLDFLSASKVFHNNVVEEGESRYNTLNDLSLTPPPDKNTNKVSIVLNTNVINVSDSGEVVKLKFKVLDEAQDGFAHVSIVPVAVFKYVGDNADEAYLSTNITNGGVEVSRQLLGDIDLDEDVDIDDAVLLFQHSLMSDFYPIDYKGSIDFTKDGNVDIDDAVLLFQYSLMPDFYPIG